MATRLGSLYSKTQVLPGFSVQEVDQTVTDMIYIGYEDVRGNWLVKKVDKTVANTTSVEFATQRNNSSYTSFATAWTNRLTLDYGTYSQIHD